MYNFLRWRTLALIQNLASATYLHRRSLVQQRCHDAICIPKLRLLTDIARSQRAWRRPLLTFVAASWTRLRRAFYPLAWRASSSSGSSIAGPQSVPFKRDAQFFDIPDIVLQSKTPPRAIRASRPLSQHIHPFISAVATESCALGCYYSSRTD